MLAITFPASGLLFLLVPLSPLVLYLAYRLRRTTRPDVWTFPLLVGVLIGYLGYVLPPYEPWYAHPLHWYRELVGLWTELVNRPSSFVVLPFTALELRLAIAFAFGTTISVVSGLIFDRAMWYRPLLSDSRTSARESAWRPRLPPKLLVIHLVGLLVPAYVWMEAIAARWCVRHSYTKYYESLERCIVSTMNNPVAIGFAVATVGFAVWLLWLRPRAVWLVIAYPAWYAVCYAIFFGLLLLSLGG